jgi:hypothetical protein
VPKILRVISRGTRYRPNASRSDRRIPYNPLPQAAFFRLGGAGIGGTSTSPSTGGASGRGQFGVQQPIGRLPVDGLAVFSLSELALAAAPTASAPIAPISDRGARSRGPRNRCGSVPFRDHADDGFADVREVSADSRS